MDKATQWLALLRPCKLTILSYKGHFQIYTRHTLNSSLYIEVYEKYMPIKNMATEIPWWVPCLQWCHCLQFLNKISTWKLLIQNLASSVWHFQTKNIPFGTVNLWKFQQKTGVMALQLKNGFSIKCLQPLEKTVYCGHKTLNNSEHKETRQLMLHSVTNKLLHILIFPIELRGIQLLEAIFWCRKMNTDMALWCSAQNENTGLLFFFQVAKFNSSLLLLETKERVLINLMSFP